MLIIQEFFILHHIQQKIIPLRECRLGIPLGKYPFVVMLRLSALLYIHIDIMEFVHMVMIKVTSCPELVPPVTVIDPKTEVIDTYKRRGREWYIACLK